jgi:hypothetical protein
LERAGRGLERAGAGYITAVIPTANIPSRDREGVTIGLLAHQKR